MSRPPERLYALVPEIYRQRDLLEGEPLRALLLAFEQLFTTLEQDIGRLYEDAFIETCALELIPYIGDLVGAQLEQGDPLLPSHRRYVANLMGYRRRKGMPGVIENAASDVTGWPIHLQEAASELAGTSALSELQIPSARSIDLRDAEQTGALGTPFSVASRRADLRRRSPSHYTLGVQQGRMNLDTLNLYVWRLQVSRVEQADACPVSAAERYADASCWRFHPLGVDAPLYHEPEARSAAFSCAGPEVFPRPVTANALERTLRYAQGSAPRVGPRVDVGADLNEVPLMVARVAPDGQTLLPFTADQVVVADLERWQAPLAPQSARVAVDPERGRLKLLNLNVDKAPAELRVSCAVASPRPLGGGSYLRELPSLSGEVAHAWVGALRLNRARGHYDNLSDALDDWARRQGVFSGGAPAQITLLDSRRYAASGPRLSPTLNRIRRLPCAGRTLFIVADQGARPTVYGELHFTGGPGQSRVCLSGLIWAGRLYGESNLELRLSDCTVAPLSSQPQGAGPTEAPAADQVLSVIATRCVLAGLMASRDRCFVRAETSIVDARMQRAARPLASGPPLVPRGRAFVALGICDGARAIDGLPLGPRRTPGPGPNLTLRSVTVQGEARAASLDACDTLFTGLVRVEERDGGQVQTSALPAGSVTPARARCVELDRGDDAQPERARRLAFSARRYGAAAYLQLRVDCPLEVRTGGEGGGEIGAYSAADQAQRLRNLHRTLLEYVPATLQPTVVLVD